MYGGEDGVARGVSTRGKGLVGMEHIRDNGCPAWGPLSMSEFAFVSHELPLHMKFHPLMWFIYVLYPLPCNFLMGCRVFEAGVLTFRVKYWFLSIGQNLTYCVSWNFGVSLHRVNQRDTYSVRFYYFLPSFLFLVDFLLSKF